MEIRRRDPCSCLGDRGQCRRDMGTCLGDTGPRDRGRGFCLGDAGPRPGDRCPCLRNPGTSDADRGTHAGNPGTCHENPCLCLRGRSFCDRNRDFHDGNPCLCLGGSGLCDAGRGQRREDKGSHEGDRCLWRPDRSRRPLDRACFNWRPRAGGDRSATQDSRRNNFCGSLGGSPTGPLASFSKAAGDWILRRWQGARLFEYLNRMTLPHYLARDSWAPRTI